ncbi:MAG: coat protein [Lachnospiraceae bacterium]|nr:coat protein [Lachnospiraceae bacterium]
MAITKIADVIVPELFNPYVINRTMELSALVQSGIIVNSPEFDRLASEAARTHNMPFFEDLTGDSENVVEDVKVTPAKIGSNKDVSTTIFRQKAWASTNLAAALAGADPMKAIGDLVAGFWSRDMQKELIALLAGIFGTYTPEGGKAATPMADHILDLTAQSSAAAKIISASAFIDACQLMGDAQGLLTDVAMHSATKAYLKKKNLIETERDSTDVEFDTYQGRRVTVDDGCPVDDGTYTTYLFSQGAIALGNGSPVGYVLTEMDRDKQTGGGIDYLINRKAYILHMRGVAYTGNVREAIESPSREELKMAENWNPVYEPKQLRVVAMKHKLG